ncbi:hypothetical protein DV736_g2524, partial [Chaetothyriales sp. CBS 134916]
MDFTLALTHFCETHGPRSILCTQVLPLECGRCLPPSPALHPQSSTESLHTHVHDSDDQSHSIPSLRRHDTNTTLPTDFSRASTTVDSDPESVSIERHPYFKAFSAESSQFLYGRGQSDTYRNTNSAPVLRSREFVCLGPDKATQERSRGSSHESKSSVASSLETFLSPHTHTNTHADDCHDHTLTYLTSKSPESALTYATLRNSVVRTLSCELLPRGMSDGPFCFGDSTTGYTIAHSFRLSDPKARGRRRTYAFVALAGTDASRAFKACPLIWDAFANLAKSIEVMATRKQEDARRHQEEEATKGKRNYTSASSFLTQRQVEPDGTPRRAGHTTPRSLSEIVGDDHIFAILHQYFVALLKCLGDRFGGLPLADNQSIYHILAAEQAFAIKTVSTTPTSLKRDLVSHPDKSRDNATTASTLRKTQESSLPVHDDIALLKKRMSQGLSLQCAPIAHETAGPTQVVM